MTASPIRIAYLEPANFGQQGDHVYRTAQPCRALARAEPHVQTLSGNWLSPAMRAAAGAADVLVLLKVAEPDLLPLVHARRAAGRATVYEINDDFTDVQPWNTTAGFFAQPENRSLVFQLARVCDALQLSAPGLYDKFGDLNPRRRLVPNQLERLGSPPVPRADSADPVTIGWAGSYGHREDLEPVLASLRAVLAERPQARLAVMGDRRLAALFDFAPRDRFTFTPAGSLRDYEAFVAGLDIGLAPLLPTAFNRGRSDIKFLEYASRGVASVCADEVPYRSTVEHGRTGCLFDTPEELTRLLLELVDQPARRIAIASAGFAYVRDARQQAQHAPDLLAFFRGLVPEAPEPDAGAFDAVFACARPDPDAASYRVCEPTSAEQHLYNGLLSQDQPKRARRDFNAALAADASNYLAHLHLARCEEGARATRHFEQAERLAPDAVSVHFLRALSCLQAGDLDAARRHLERCHPLYAPARARLAATYARAGDIARARATYADCIAVNPHYGPAVLGLASLTAAHGALDDAQAILATHLTTCGDDHHYWLLAGQVATARRDAHAAVVAFEQAEALAGPALNDVLPGLAKAYALAGQADRARATLARMAGRKRPGTPN